MKYFGQKSVSSVMSVILHVLWYVVLVLSILATLVITVVLFANSVDNSFNAYIVKEIGSNQQDLKEWQQFQNVPTLVRFLLLPYFAVISVLLLKIIRKAKDLFVNFKNDVLFNENNANIITGIAKLTVWYGVLTFNFSTLLTSVFLLMLCEIIKNGAMLQEENDLTV
jgi:hypothetical protein